MFTESTTEKYLVTKVSHYGQGGDCSGIMFTGKIDDVKSYYTEKTSHHIKEKNMHIGDIVLIDADGNIVTENCSPEPFKTRIQNITTLFEGIKKSAQQKTPNFFGKEQVLPEEKNFVWQYFNAAGEMVKALDSLIFTQKKEEEITPLVEIIDGMVTKSTGICGKMKVTEKKAYAYSEFLTRQLKAIHVLSNIGQSQFKIESKKITTCDNNKRKDYLLVTKTNEDGSLNGVVVTNMVENGDNNRQLRFVNNIECFKGEPLLGDFVGLERSEEGKWTAFKEEDYPKSFESRLNNLFVVNEMVYDKYVSQNPSKYVDEIFLIEKNITLAAAQVFSHCAGRNIESDNVLDKNKAFVFDAVGYGLWEDVKEIREQQNVSGICELNKQMRLAEMVVNLPKREFSEHKSSQKTLDMF